MAMVVDKVRNSDAFMHFSTYTFIYGSSSVFVMDSVNKKAHLYQHMCVFHLFCLFFCVNFILHNLK